MARWLMVLLAIRTCGRLPDGGELVLQEVVRPDRRGVLQPWNPVGFHGGVDLMSEPFLQLFPVLLEVCSFQFPTRIVSVESNERGDEDKKRKKARPYLYMYIYSSRVDPEAQRTCSSRTGPLW